MANFIQTSNPVATITQTAMSDVVNKRAATSSTQTNKRQELSSALTKPGRKPVQTEPKDKRTAQNRAAQRAFRERKEKKMKELETKVEELERQKSQLNTESEFLRSQVETLIHELSKYRGETDVLSLLPTSIPQESKKMVRTPSSNTTNSSSVGVTPSSSTLRSSSSSGVYEFPWKLSNSQNPSGSNSPLDLTKAGQLPSPTSINQNPGLTAESVKSSSVSSESPNSNIEDFLNSRNSNFDNRFDESVDGFCSNLGQACGNKDIPLPKETSSIRNPGVIDSLSNFNSNSDIQTLFSPNSLQNDPLAEFDPTPIDQNLVFGLNAPETNLDGLFGDFNKYHTDPLASLVTEESIFDPLRATSNSVSHSKPNPITTTSLHNLEAKHKVPEADEDCNDNLDNMVVPNREGSLLKCSEIWERITTHPRYSEIDIDGLCMELKHKAKCSESGVVVDDADVDSLLQRAALKYPIKTEPDVVDFSMFK